ncbi:CCD73 protein, partial [Bucco capensis]|nr:CCD73 protein [Bucco capensis]
LQSPAETLLSIRLLDFKTSLLEAVEELRIRRESENNYEDQISKIVVEKQELEWQKETLKHQMDALHQQNKEALAAFKKQFQARMFAMEEEKGKYQLAVETKEKEIDGLKEALKALQVSKYTLQKKLNEMDQKLQMHLTAKEEHHKKLNEVERCYATIASQFGTIKGFHGKLEHSVQEAIQLNKKLASVNKRQETEISNLKEELKKVTTDLIRSKVTSQYRVGEENINLAAKEKQFHELQQKIRMETAVTKKVQEENTHLKEEKLEILSSLQCVQELLQRTTQTNARMESELKTLKEESQTLERDNELQREKAKENEEKFLNLQNEHERALRTWKKEEESMRREIDTLTNELNALKGLHRHLDDPHPPEGNQPAEQVADLQSGQEHSKDSEMQAVQKEKESLQSGIRKDGNFEHEETEVKNTKDYSLSTEELQIEQKNTFPPTDLQVLGNSFKDEINVEEKQREASPRNSLCTATDFITQGQSSEIHGSECRAAENLGATCTVLLAENNASLEQKLQASTEPLATCPTQARKVLLDTTDTAGVCKESGSQETDSSKQELCSTTEESACTKADNKSNGTAHKESVLTPEAANTESEVVLCTEQKAVPTEEHSDALCLLVTCNVCPPKPDRRNMDEMHSKQPEQDTTKQSGTAKNTCTSNAEALFPGKADALEIIAPKKTSTDRINKLIPCKKTNDDIQKHSIENGRSLEMNNSTNNTLLKEKKDSLSSTVPGRKFAEGHLKESCSFPMRTSGNLVNITGRSSFDLSTSDKKAEKTPVYLNFSDLSSCSRVNQMRGQAPWTSASKEPSLLKEKLSCFMENIKAICKPQCQNLSENVDRRETGLGSPSLKRAADTLNTSSIHPAPQGEPAEGWNAAAKTFYESSFPTEHVKGFTASEQEQKSPVAVTPARSGSAPGQEDRSSSHNSTTHNHIEEIEKILNLERLHSAKKRKYEE